MHRSMEKATATMGGTIIALNRDATATLDIFCHPQTAATKPTAWLLLHTVPVTAGLSSVLQRLLAAQAVIASAEATVAVPSIPSSEDASLRQPSVALDKYKTVASATKASAAPSRGGAQLPFVEVVRVVYVVSEIHAYSLLLRCRTSHLAQALKSELEKGAALGTTAPVEYISDTGTLTVHNGSEEVSVMCAMPLDEAITYGLQGDSIPSSSTRRPILTSAVATATAISCCSTSQMDSVSLGGGVVALQSPPTEDGPMLEATHPFSNREEPCAVCLVEPLLAHPCLVTLCQHVFHITCYAMVDSAECPLCRFSVYDLLNDARCEACGTYEDLWICLICGHIGCGKGRYQHQQRHYETTGHTCAMQSTTNRVWNHATRSFLHTDVALHLAAMDDDRPGAETDVDSASYWSSGNGATLPDSALQVALTERKEAAVHRFYEYVLSALMEEQRRWLSATRSAAVTSSAEQLNPLTAAAPGLLSVVSETEGEDVVRRAVAAEAHARMRLAHQYVEATRQLLSMVSLCNRRIATSQRAKREELQEQVMLQTHTNIALQGRIAKLQQRIVEAEARGTKEQQARQAEEQLLQGRITAALEQLTS